MHAFPLEVANYISVSWSKLFQNNTANGDFLIFQGTFALRSKFVRDICYAGFLDDDVTKSFKDIVNKTTLVAVSIQSGLESEQLLF